MEPTSIYKKNRKRRGRSKYLLSIIAEDFLNNAISVKKLEKAMRLGNLGEQAMLMSQTAFERIQFLNAEEAERAKYYALRTKRDKAVRAEYLSSDRKLSYGPDAYWKMFLGSDLYWSGWVLAYFQWYTNRTYTEIWDSISIRMLQKMYPTLHEADIAKTVDAMVGMMKPVPKNSVQTLRLVRGLMQQEVADRAHMTVSQLQRIEYGERKTGCLALVEPGTRYCEEHKALHPEDTRSAAKRGYGSRWRKESKRFLRIFTMKYQQMNILGNVPENIIEGVVEGNRTRKDYIAEQILQKIDFTRGMPRELSARLEFTA